MKRLLWCGLALQLCAVPVFAQTGTRPQPGAPGMAGDSTARMPNTGAPGATPGANSFTEAQARSRLESAGYSQVGGLTKGDDGIWRGSALKGGISVPVSVDYKGTVFPN
jgi:protein CpxP